VSKQFENGLFAVAKLLPLKIAVFWFVREALWGG
jgi:hypothetical protein